MSGMSGWVEAMTVQPGGRTLGDPRSIGQSLTAGAATAVPDSGEQHCVTGGTGSVQ